MIYLFYLKKVSIIKFVFWEITILSLIRIMKLLFYDLFILS